MESQSLEYHKGEIMSLMPIVYGIWIDYKKGCDQWAKDNSGKIITYDDLRVAKAHAFNKNTESLIFGTARHDVKVIGDNGEPRDI